jgi:hypothetical protein
VARFATRPIADCGAQVSAHRLTRSVMRLSQFAARFLARPFSAPLVCQLTQQLAHTLTSCLAHHLAHPVVRTRAPSLSRRRPVTETSGIRLDRSGHAGASRPEAATCSGSGSPGAPLAAV